MSDYKDEDFIFIKTDDIGGMWNCCNCGAFHVRKDMIKHYGSCQPGEAEYWEKFYTEANEEVEAWEAEKPFSEEKIIYQLDEAGLEPILNNNSVTTTSFYVKFEDERLRSLRVGDHPGRSKYRYKWNLRLDLEKSYVDNHEGIIRYYYCYKELDKMILHMQNYLAKCQKSKEPFQPGLKKKETK